jgi:phage gpG-like protein
MIYGFEVYAGKKYATIIATKYTTVIIINLVPTNLPYNAFNFGLSTLSSSSVFIFHRFLTAITYNQKSAMADRIAKNFKIVL